MGTVLTGPESIGELLHDATLRAVRTTEASIELDFEVLRRIGDATSKDPVTLTLAGVRVIAVAYDPFLPNRPWSELELPDAARLNGLESLGERVYLEVLVGSEAVRDDMEVATQLDARRGSLSDGSVHAIALSSHVGDWTTTVWLGCSELSVSDARGPLSWSDWANDCNAWWQAWQESSRQTGNVVAGDDYATSFDEQPPTDAPYALERGALPSELTGLVRELLEAWFERDRDRLTDVWWTHLGGAGQPPEHLLEPGPWFLARSVEGAWFENRRALVVLGGVTHWPADDEPAERRAAELRIELRRSADRWFIRRIGEHAAA